MQSRSSAEWFLNCICFTWYWEREGRGIACLARCQLTAQLDIVEDSEPPCLAACHFGIVSAIESLFNLSLSEGTGLAIHSTI